MVCWWLKNGCKPSNRKSKSGLVRQEGKGEKMDSQVQEIGREKEKEGDGYRTRAVIFI